MTSAYLPRLLSLEDWKALPEDDSAHIELQEGVLIVSPRPLRRHARAAARIWRQLDDQLPSGLEALIEVEVCVDEQFPATVRTPDIVVTRSTGTERLFAAADVLLAIEVVSPGSKRTDTVTKRSEYAEAGIPHYWVVDLDPPVTLTAYHLAGEFGYAEPPATTVRLSTTEPATLHIDLDKLVSQR